jgi:hypothetical protein
MLDVTCPRDLADARCFAPGIDVGPTAPAMLRYSRHAHSRKNRRCKRDRLVELLHTHFDRDVYVRRGTWAWSVSAERCEQLQEAGLITAAEAERLPSLVIVIADDGMIVTVVRGNRRLGQYLSRN